MVEFNKIDNNILGKLKAVVGDGYVLTEKFDIEPYSHDETEDLQYWPEVAVKPADTEQISAILKLCNEHTIPVTPRGGGTGLSGGALPVYGGVVLSLERLNKILEIDIDNMMVVTQPGVIVKVLQDTLEEQRLFYPVDPASKESCLIGGNIAENSGGPRAVKYGVTKDYVYGLKAVLPDGRVFSSGGKLLKNVSGYNLVQLLVGAEGTLAVVTEITLKVIAKPKHVQTMLVPFNSLGEAAKTLTEIFKNRIVPSAAEFIEQRAIKAAEDKFERKFPYSDSAALLLIEIDGNYPDLLEQQAERIGEICLEGNAVDVFIADNPTKQAELWDTRRKIGEAVKSIAPYKEEDTVVPRSKLPELVEKIKQISEAHNITSISYGHAGDGNIHCNIIKKDITEERWRNELPKVIAELFTEVVKLGGTISGEHGIGWVQKEYLKIACSETELDLMRAIKNVFDPKGILNPGKVLP